MHSSPALPALLVVLLLLILQDANSHLHNCVHDKLKHSFVKTAHSLDELTSERMLAKRHTKIFVFTPTSHVKAYIEDDLIPTAVQFYQQTLSVLRFSGNLTSDYDTLCDLTVPSIYHDYGVNADIVILIDAAFEDSEYIAYARACSIADTNNRPTFGNLHLNLNYINIENDQDREQNLMTVLHEMAHIFGISSGLYEYYINPVTQTTLTNHLKQQTINGVNSYLIDVSPLTSMLQEYFNCSNIQGALLENEGSITSAYSHLERRVFYNEIMTASVIENSRISNFTLAFLEGTGWYKVNYSMADPMFWGKGKGCDFYDTPCMSENPPVPNFAEFCGSMTAIGCSPSRRYGAHCGDTRISTASDLITDFNYWGNNTVVSDDFADNCPYFNYDLGKNCEDPSLQYKANIPDETYAVGSRCFMGSLSKSSSGLPTQTNYCLKTSCEQREDLSYFMRINMTALNITNITCNSSGLITIPGYSGQLECPDPEEYCSTYGMNYCGRGCTGRGECVNNKCECTDGWGGDDCNTRVYVLNCTRCTIDEINNACYGDTCSALPVIQAYVSSSDGYVLQIIKPLLGLIIILLLI